MPSYGSNDGYGRQMLREDRSSIRQSKTYRQYESGNAIKSMLGIYKCCCATLLLSFCDNL